MTIFSEVVDKAACDTCAWQTEAPSRRKAIQRAEDHYREQGHDEFDFSHRLRFGGDQ